MSNAINIKMHNIVELLCPGITQINYELKSIYKVKYRLYIRLLKNGIGFYYSQKNNKIAMITREEILDNTYMIKFPKIILDFMKTINTHNG